MKIIRAVTITTLIVGLIAFGTAQGESDSSTIISSNHNIIEEDLAAQTIDNSAKVYSQRAAEAAIYKAAVEAEALRVAEEARKAEEARRAAKRKAASAKAAAAPRVAPTGDVWSRLAQCESGMRNANTGNGYYGYFQFSPSTWRSVGGSGLPTDHDYATQLHFAQVLQARSGWGQWPACSAKLGLR